MAKQPPLQATPATEPSRVDREPDSAAGLLSRLMGEVSTLFRKEIAVSQRDSVGKGRSIGSGFRSKGRSHQPGSRRRNRFCRYSCPAWRNSPAASPKDGALVGGSHRRRGGGSHRLCDDPKWQEEIRSIVFQTRADPGCAAQRQGDGSKEGVVSDINKTSNLRDDARKDPATLEREIDQTRANMDRTLGALERKFSPGQLLDQAMEFARDNGGEFANNLGRSVKENPVPALLTAVGIAWMVASSNRPKPSMADAYDERDTPTEFNAVDFDDPGYDDDAGDYKEGLTDKAQRLKASAEGTLSEAGQRVKSAAERARQKLAGTKDTVSGGLRRTSSTAQVQTQRVREGFNSLLTEQPLLLGALGIAVGAAIGAALPATEQEDRLFGSARDKALSEVKQRGTETYEQVRDKANAVGEEAKQSISNAVREST
jgi:ElaB/YqjD/DUF883 family membrane-anchored ribosome-binding protein